MLASWPLRFAMAAIIRDAKEIDIHALSATKVYRYFGYGSNVIPSTMKALRQIEVREVTAAVLPDYELFFSSAAFVRPVPVENRSTEDDGDHTGNDGTFNHDTNRLPRSGKAVHGLLYTLSEDEFARVGTTEGVPFGYRWQSCLVYPYRGDGRQSGIDSLNEPNSKPIQAYTLVEPSASALNPQGQTKNRRKVNPMVNGMPPSVSYLGLMRDGARLWNFDKSYQNQLANTDVAKTNNLLFPDGWEGPTLELAEKAIGIKRTYMIDGY